MLDLQQSLYSETPKIFFVLPDTRSAKPVGVISHQRYPESGSPMPS